MSDRCTFALKGIVKTLSPLSQTPYNPRGRGAGEVGHIQHLARLAVHTPQSAPKDDAGTTRGLITQVPIFSSNALRGKLRREAAYDIFDRFMLEGVKIPLAVAGWMRAGAGRNAKDTLPNWMTPARLQREVMEEGNIHTGLFGAGMQCPSAFKVDDLLPCVQELNDAGMLHDLPPMPELPRAYEVVAARAWVRVNDLNRVGDQANEIYLDAKEVEQAIKDAEEMRQKRTEDRKAKKKAKEEGTEYEAEEELAAAAGQLGAVEYIVPNMAMAFRSHFDNVSPAQVGLFVAALRRFADHPYLGAHRRWGFGHVSMRLNDDQGRMVAIGTDGFVQQGFDEELAAYEEWRSGIELKRLYTLGYLNSLKEAA